MERHEALEHLRLMRTSALRKADEWAGKAQADRSVAGKTRKQFISDGAMQDAAALQVAINILEGQLQ